VADRDVYLRYHIAQRLMFWTNIPAEAFYGTDTVGPPGLSEQDAQYGHSREKASLSPLSPEYPTFAQGGMDDPERQIPGMSGEREISLGGRHRRDTYDEDDDDSTEELMENTRANASTGGRRDDRMNRPVQPAPPPRMPPAMSAMPPSIQQMVQTVKPRFAANQAVPQIQLQPSTASTLASSSGASFKFPRPDSTFSRNSVSSPAHVLSDPFRGSSAPARSRPKSHSVKRSMDDTKLKPPKKSALRRASQFAGTAPVEQQSTYDVDLRKDTPQAQTASDREVSRRSMVRFDLHRLSTASTVSSSSPVSSSSVESLLADILPAKPPKSKPGRAEPPARTTRFSAPPPGGSEQDSYRPSIKARPPNRQREMRSRSPSRLSYLCSDGSSQESPFVDPEHGPESPFADTAEFASPSSTVESEQQFNAKRKKRMSHLVL
jgi:hypothetical protein